MPFNVMLNLNIQKDGSFSIQQGNLKILNCFPGIDNFSVKPVSTKIEKHYDETLVLYTLLNGKIELRFQKRADELIIKSKLSEITEPVNWFCPVFESKIESLQGIYRQGFGMGGPSGYCSVEDVESRKETVKSFGMMSLRTMTGSENVYMFIFSVSHERFINQYDLDFTQKDESQLRFSAGFRVEKIHEESIEFPDIHIFLDNELENGLERVANSIAKKMNARNVHPPAYHWCSWYYLYNNLSHKILKEYLEGFTTIRPKIAIRYVQIDAGYFPSVGDWLYTNHLWPNGLKSAFDDIKRYGYRPGIWIAPFMIGSRSKLYKEHPDWILYHTNGEPVIELRQYNEPKIWGYQDEEYYVLDTSHPAAMKYIREVFRTLRKWGAEFFKTDIMLWGIQDSTKVKRYTPGKTSIEYFRELLSAIREEIGEDTYWLGCIAPFLPFVRYADGMRIGGDIGAQWNETGFGPTNMIQEIVADNYFNNIYWQNDPDAVMLRNFHIYLKPDEVESLALLQALSGGAIYTSDPLHEIAKDRVALFRFIKPKKKVKPKIPFIDEKKKEIVLVHSVSRGKFIIFFFNPTKEEIVTYYPIENLTGKKTLYTRLWHTNEWSKEKLEDIVTTIPGHGCKLFFASTDRIVNREIENLWEW